MCRPLAIVRTAGQAGDAPAFAHVMARLCGPRQRGRPGTRPDVVLADKAYFSRAVREHLRKRGIRAVIPIAAEQRDHRLRRGSRGGGPPALDREASKQRMTVERCINRRKQRPGIAADGLERQHPQVRQPHTGVVCPQLNQRPDGDAVTVVAALALPRVRDSERLVR